LVEIKELLIATGLCHQNGKMECWNVGSKGRKLTILITEAPINHRSITPSFSPDHRPIEAFPLVPCQWQKEQNVFKH